MLNWLRRWLGEERTDFYRPHQRLIYSFFNGREVVKADPLVLYKAIMEVGAELDIDLKVSRSLSKDAATAHTKALEKIRKIFQLKALDQGGLTDVEALELFNHFWSYLEAQKKSGETLPMSATAVLPPSASSSVADLTTPNSLASGSTGADCSTARPGPLPVASE